MNLKPPRITFDQIRAKADGIRCLFKDKALPLDILAAAEFDLKYEIRPAKNLRDKGNTDALLLRAEKVIFVDEGFLMDDRQQDSVRFSVAHELGHAYLHPELHASIHTIEQWVKFQDKIDRESFGWFESQAEEFAGRLLVPVDALEDSLRRKILPITRKHSNLNWSNESAIDVAAEIIHKDFGLSPKRISIRIAHENLWAKLIAPRL